VRLGFFSPLPPARSGIADYAQTLLDHLRPLAEVEVFDGRRPAHEAAACDALLFQVGNNGWHADAYRSALSLAGAPPPRLVVMHEANLHHLLADMTIKAGDWDAYLRECEYEGGPAALAHARRVRNGETGPDYDGLPMVRRLLEAASGVIVHSRYLADQIRRYGFAGPVACIPHGAWLPRESGQAHRHALGLDPATPLVGIFGFLKPYKRIAESLRAFRRLVRLNPRVRMILVGEEHPDFPVRALIQSLELTPYVRLAGFAPLKDFEGYLAACDVVLNLRYPTVGETSGSLLRALGLGKAVLVSEVGSFAELPDDICLKVPVGAGEEDLIFEYLNLLTSRLDLARTLGAAARRYVARECNWDLAARRYLEFARAVAEGRPYQDPAPARGSEPEPEPSREPSAAPPPETILEWVREPNARAYAAAHVSRLQKTLSIIPPGGPEDHILEMGAYLQITPALRFQLGYGHVRGCYYGKLGVVDRKEVRSENGETFVCDIDHFDAERDRFPYADETFTTVLCCELIEHLYADPMHLMAEVHRILRPGGRLVLTTPNIAALRGVAAMLEGYHPGFFHAYLRPTEGEEPAARHNREYTPREIHQLLENSGFEVTLLETGPFREEAHPEYGWVEHLLRAYNLPVHLRGDGIYAVGRKTGPVRERYPAWLYS
jgi:glycosyltransferase involved in cell wall biosynthesis/SAM-dependent methyltransferase